MAPSSRATATSSSPLGVEHERSCPRREFHDAAQVEQSLDVPTEVDDDNRAGNPHDRGVEIGRGRAFRTSGPAARGVGEAGQPTSPAVRAR